uniref:Uncharacterized protein n=1 Tax=Panagrolaimus sp. ES5 TaxID=591445 RepID=A0AC34GU72_9BILA
MNLILVASGSDDEERLVEHIFKGYNQLVRPVKNLSSSPVEISFSLALVLLINVDEKNQIMQTNVWPTMRWHDYQLQWKPTDYGNIKTIRVPPDKVWLPDIVLFNNADGNYEVSFYSNVVVEHTGEMLWVPPAIYKSSCTIDVEYFPFDEQVCAMIFGSWTFNQDEVTIKYLMGKRQVELNDYSPSGIWDLMEVPGELIQKKSKIAYQIRIRRYGNLSFMIMRRPNYDEIKKLEKERKRKSDATDEGTPRSGDKYLPGEFIEMNQAKVHHHPYCSMNRQRRTMTNKKDVNSAKTPNGTHQQLALLPPPLHEVEHVPLGRQERFQSFRNCSEDLNTILSEEAIKAMDAIEYITEHLRKDNQYKRIREEWKYVAMVIDRLLLYVFFAVTVGGTCGIFFSAPNVFEYVNQTAVIEQLKRSAEAEMLS